MKLETLEIKQGNGGTYRVSHDGAWVGAPSTLSFGDRFGERIDAECYGSSDRESAAVVYNTLV